MTIAPKYQESRDNRAKSFSKVIFSRLFTLIRVCASHLAQCLPRLSDSGEDAKVKGMRKVGGAGKRPPVLSPVSTRLIFVFALSQFSGPDYLGSCNTLAQCSDLAILLILRCSFQWCRLIFPNLSLSKVEKKNMKRSVTTHVPCHCIYINELYFI